MGTVFIRNLSVRGKHGVGEEERRVEQEFIVSLEAECDTAYAAQTDSVADTIDYDALRAIVMRVVGGSSYMLLEKLASTIADETLKDSRIQKITISIQKPAVWESGVPGVRIERGMR